MTNDQSVVELEQVIVRRRGRTVLDEVSLSVASGCSLADGGVNGSGKSTLLRLLANLYRPDGGRRSGRSRSAFVPAALEPPAVSADRWVRAVPRPGRPTPDSAFALARDFGFDAPPTTPCRALSFGTLRKLLLAEALSSAEQLIVLDEATAGLDEVGVMALAAQMAGLCAEGTAIVVADQGPEPSLPVDRFVVIGGGGRLIEQTVEKRETPAVSVVSLSGPSAQRPALLRAAAQLGYSPAEEVTS
jgi:ABC-type multidrug transport system ATPase subunit